MLLWILMYPRSLLTCALICIWLPLVTSTFVFKFDFNNGFSTKSTHVRQFPSDLTKKKKNYECQLLLGKENLIFLGISYRLLSSLKLSCSTCLVLMLWSLHETAMLVQRFLVQYGPPLSDPNLFSWVSIISLPWSNLAYSQHRWLKFGQCFCFKIH